MRRILIVDDNDAIRESLVDALTDEGFQVEDARDGIAALRIAAHDPPSVILLDLMMPGIDGKTVAERLLKNGCASPVIVVSADRGAAERARTMGAAGFLAKPFDLDALLTLIDGVTGVHQAARPPTPDRRAGAGR